MLRQNLHAKKNAFDLLWTRQLCSYFEEDLKEMNKLLLCSEVQHKHPPLVLNWHLEEGQVKKVHVAF